MSKIKKTLSTLICVPIAAGMIAFGCSPERLNEANKPKPKVEYLGMPPYNTNSEWPDDEVHSHVIWLLLTNIPSAKKGLKSRIHLDGELVSLTTFYQHGTPEGAKPDKDGFYPTECTRMIQHKTFRHLDPKEMSTTPTYTKHGKFTIVEYDNKLDKKIDVRIMIHEKYDETKSSVVKVQELDIGADGTIEERLIVSEYDRDFIFEKAPDYKK